MTSNQRFSIFVGFLTFCLLILLSACAKSNSSESASPPPTPAPSAYSGYPGQRFGPGGSAQAPGTFDPYTSLNGMGRWEYIGNQYYFIPNAAQMESPDQWAPYQNGYWIYDDSANQGWTWNSYDPWGRVTEHYGVWRHHARHGWVWLPFSDRRYQPHCVSWFDDGDYIGWYPYANDFANYYAAGAAHGFDDGFWMGHQAALQLNVFVGFRFGVSVVPRTMVTQRNLFKVVIRDHRVTTKLVVRTHQPDRIRMVGRVPGGNPTLAFDFIQKRSPVAAARGQASDGHSGDGKGFREPPKASDEDRDARRRFAKLQSRDELKPVDRDKNGGDDRRLQQPSRDRHNTTPDRGNRSNSDRPSSGASIGSGGGSQFDRRGDRKADDDGNAKKDRGTDPQPPKPRSRN